MTQARLGTKVKALAFERQAKCSVRCFSLQDEFIHHYGSHEQLLAAHGLTAEAIHSAI